jgi:hypothetical protein
VDDSLEIKRSTQPAQYQAGIVIAFSIILLIFATQLFNAFDNLVGADTSFLTRLARWIIIGLTVAALLIIHSNKKKLSYSATADSIIVRRRMLGAVKKKYYAISSVTSVELDQSFFGGQMGYGNIVVNMDRLGKTETITLMGVEDPEKTLSKIQERVDQIRR